MSTDRISLVEMIRKSGLIDAAHLERILLEVPDHADIPSAQFADRLVQTGHLTRFQADLLLQGKYKGFILRNKYKMLRLIGSGGMGRVFLCEHIMLHRLVAVKVLPTDLAMDPGNVERFFREARAIAALDDPNIVRVYDVEQEGKTPLIVMEYVEGKTLQEVVVKHGVLKFEQAANYIAQAALGLQHAADKGLVHRDIKPGNLLLDRRGVVKILDMGLARFLHPRNQDGVTERFDSHSVLGTADYLAPEQAINSSTVDVRADIYALGGTLHFLLTGQTPYDAPTVAEKLLAHQMPQLPNTRGLRPDLPPKLEAVLQRMLAKNMKDRYQKPKDVVEALAGFTDPLRPIAPESQVMRGESLPNNLQSTSNSSDLRRTRPDVASLNPSQTQPTSNRHWLWIGLTVSAVVLISGISILLMSLANNPKLQATKPATDKAVPVINKEKSTNKGPIKIRPEDGFQHVDQNVSMEFQVRRASYSNSKTALFLNSKEDYRDPECFTVMIPISNAKKLYPETKFEELHQLFRDKQIRVQGVIKIYQNKSAKIDQAEIIVEEENQLQILN